ncbi:hypothetical protein INS49_012957 [Diaporthe citri]|uniref:uncharacterized protein n=1 Tax=Diaporthe citri TaxID=83186 RepID=UPI001C825F5C|nr:uncharacterized protein INS49_012957 [Diaporthe citri]KAG6359436.1 hypothetical protein INS49_012957 [Diaporthe citri]
MAPFQINDGGFESAELDATMSRGHRRGFKVVGPRRQGGVTISMTNDGTITIAIPTEVVMTNRVQFPAVDAINPGRHDNVLCRILKETAEPVTQVTNAYEKLQQLGDYLVRNQNSVQFTASVSDVKADAQRGGDIMVRDVLMKSADTTCGSHSGV